MQTEEAMRGTGDNDTSVTRGPATIKKAGRWKPYEEVDLKSNPASLRLMIPDIHICERQLSGRLGQLER